MDKLMNGGKAFSNEFKIITILVPSENKHFTESDMFMDQFKIFDKLHLRGNGQWLVQNLRSQVTTPRVA
jgi:hypothetical protein